MKNNIKVYICNKEEIIDVNMSIRDIINTYNKNKLDVVAVKVNNEIISADYKLNNKDNITFLYQNDRDGNKLYVSGLKFVLINAVEELYHNQAEIFFEHSIDKGICFTLTIDEMFKQNALSNIKYKMKEIIDADIPFKRVRALKKDAILFFNKSEETEKALNIQNVSNNFVTLYNLDNQYNYFYTDMPYSTKCLKNFDVIHVDNDKYVLLFPLVGNDLSVPKYTHYPLNMLAFRNYKKWIHSINIFNVSDVNKLVADRTIEDFIRVNELFLQKNILTEADKIVNRQNIKIILIAGPSSSGKTTTSMKLMNVLQTYGKNILRISIDDYYLDQSRMPKEAVENRDFESVDLIDLELLNNQINDLINNKSVHLPIYNFINGKKEFSLNETKINDDTLIIIEGLHALNSKLLSNISDSVKYKIYISPFEPLSIDRHNHLSTVDLRLIRRIVRDNNFRGVSAEDTINSWSKVRKGEEEFIFPFMNSVNSVINTSLIYEVGVLKVYVEPLLYSVPVESKAYEESKRLINFLKIFYSIPSEYVDKSSLLREFIGGSIFKY